MTSYFDGPQNRSNIHQMFSLNSIHLKELFNGFYSLVGLLVSTVPQFAPLNPKKIFFRKNGVFFMELKIDQTFNIVLPFNSIFLKEFFNEFCFFWWTCWFRLFPSLPRVSKKMFAEKMTCFTMDLKTDQTLILVLSLSSSFFYAAFH